MDADGRISEELMTRLPPDAGAMLRRVEEYRERMRDAAPDPGHPAALPEIESAWADLLQQIRDQYAEITSDLLKSFDERPLINKAKQAYREKYGITLIIFRKDPLVLLALFGRIHVVRTVLRPAEKQDRERLIAFTGKKSVVPFDEYMGIDRYSFKMSPLLMLCCACWAQDQGSYRRAAQAVREKTGNTVNTATVRRIANDVGRTVFERDCQAAERTRAAFEEGRPAFPGTKKKGTLYIVTGSEMLYTLSADEAGCSHTEIKHGLVFSSDNMEEVRNEDDEIAEMTVRKKEYVALIDSGEQFQWHLFDCACRNGYGTFENTVILSDGSSWTAGMASRLFPDAVHILDLHYLKENIYKFAASLFHNNSKRYKPWAEEIIEDIEERGDWQTALTRIPKDVEFNNSVNLYDYIYSNRNSLDYPACRKRGFIADSGSAESGSRAVMQARYRHCRMRWLAEFAQYMISLRVKYCSSIWLEGAVNVFLQSIGQPVIEPGSSEARALFSCCEQTGHPQQA